MSRIAISLARSYLTDDMVYRGIFRDFRSADAYMAMFQNFMEFTTRLDVNTILSDGETAATFYEMETTKPERAVTFVGGGIKSATGRSSRLERLATDAPL